MIDELYIPLKVIKKLKTSWGDKADCLETVAELRVFDPLSCWECYIYSMNPEDEDQIQCILHGFTIEVCDWRLSELLSHFNAEGEAPIIDREYRPRKAKTILKLLKGQYADK